MQPNLVGRDAADSIIRRDCNRAGCTARKNGQARYPHGEKVRVIDGKQTKHPSAPRADQRPWNRDKKTAKQFSTLFSDARRTKWAIMPTRRAPMNLSAPHFSTESRSISVLRSWYFYVLRLVFFSWQISHYKCLCNIRHSWFSLVVRYVSTNINIYFEYKFKSYSNKF